jgi:cytoskeleton protein RodZ
VPEVAQSLKLAPRQVAAIESEDWGALPGNTMIRGFVRNYARVLNLDADALMRGLDATRMQRTLQLEASAGTSSHLATGWRSGCKGATTWQWWVVWYCWCWHCWLIFMCRRTSGGSSWRR